LAVLLLGVSTMRISNGLMLYSDGCSTDHSHNTHVTRTGICCRLPKSTQILSSKVFYCDGCYMYCAQMRSVSICAWNCHRWILQKENVLLKRFDAYKWAAKTRDWKWVTRETRSTFFENALK
jgi:hypothetical protein